MESKQKIYIVYLIGIVLALIELLAIIMKGNQFDVYLIYFAVLIVIAGLFQITLQLDKIIELTEK